MSASALLVASKPVQTVRPIVKNEAQGQGLPQGQQGFAELLGEVEELAGLAAPLLQNQPVTTPLSSEGQASAKLIAQPGNLAAAAPELQQAAASVLAGEVQPKPQTLTEGRIEPAKGPVRHDVRREALAPQPLVQRTAEQQTAANAPVMPAEEELLGEVRTKTAPVLPEGGDTGSSARADAAQLQGRPDPSAAVVRQVATNLQFITRGDVERMRFSLHPEELGRVQIQLQKSGTVTRVTIVTETAQAFDALARGAGGLQQSLSQAGFETDDLRFSHREGDDQESGSRREAYEERREQHGERRSAREHAEERREVFIRPALSADDRQLFL
ncbi:flagellar hook-length control protein FliK [Parvularcula maris]|uniref:Flagellar hook-length control protein FliK n=1 Tax=Parvularcula maris TaxID=2965077 RepID=A0A9X2L9M6_9PROT|nr:flagellar hook-length control protein FliK [Parvularcula maris]MCQ8185484.1 flagellar hook-length control protein FliK [Parvularcula maris]